MALLNNMLVSTCILQQHEFQSFNLAGITKKGLQDSKYLWPIFMSGYFCLKDWYASVCLFQYIFLMMDIFFWTNMFFCHIPFFPSRTTDSRAVPEVVGYSSYFFWSCILSGFSLQSCPGCCSCSGTLWCWRLWAIRLRFIPSSDAMFFLWCCICDIFSTKHRYSNAQSSI